MKVKVLIPLIAVAGGILLYLFFSRSTIQEASMLLVNGVVYTLNEKQPMAEAIAIQGDRIAGVGTTREILASFHSPRVIDLQGKAVYPGFIDSHSHLEGLGAALGILDLNGTASVDEISSMVAQEVKRTASEGHWVRGRGWDQNRWNPAAFPTHQALDAVAKDVPVYLARVDGHAVWVNRKVLELARIDRSTPDPEGGKILRDRSGNPTGVFVDRAVELLNSVLPPPSVGERTQSVKRAVRECLRVGLTEVHDMGVDLPLVEIYRQLIQSGEFPFRVYGAVDGVGEAWNH